MEGRKQDWAKKLNHDADMTGTRDDPVGSAEAELPSRDAPNQARGLDLHALPCIVGRGGAYLGRGKGVGLDGGSGAEGIQRDEGMGADTTAGGVKQTLEGSCLHA